MEQKSDLPLLRLQIEDENGNLVVHHTNIESDDHMIPSVEVIGDAPLPGDEVVNQRMVNDVVGDDGGNVCDVTARNDLGSLCEVVDSNVVADECNDVVDDADLQGEVRGDRDVSFNNDVSDDGELVGAVSMNQDNVMTKVQCTSEENLVQGATNAENSTLPGNDNEIM